MKHERIALREGRACLETYFQEWSVELRQSIQRPCVLICPGGGYQMNSDREAEPIALAFASRGFQAAVLRYPVAPARYPEALFSLAEAAAWLRGHGEENRINTAQVTVCGFSAGGHLAASLGAFWNDPSVGLPPACRPDGLVLCYPVIATRGEFAHQGSAENVSAGDEAYRDRLNLLERVTADFPPAFLWHGGGDDCVPPENSLLLALELKKHGVPFEYHLFGSGGHGISTCLQETEMPDEVCRAWVGLCRTWLCRQFDFTP